MDSISSTGAVSAVLAQQQASSTQSAQITMLKKAMDMQAQGALQLIASLPSNNQAGLPDHIGKNINTTA